MSTTLTTLALPTSEVQLRRATLEDLPAIVELLAADPLGGTREFAGGEADIEPYRRAFHQIDSDPAQLLLVATHGTEVVGTF